MRRPLLLTSSRASGSPRSARPFLRGARLAVPGLLLSALVMTGCSEQELRDEAAGIASAAAESASSAAVDAVRDEVCQVVADNQLSEQDLAVLQGLVDTAQAAGVQSDVLTALEDVTGGDGTPPDSAVARLADACRA